MTYLERIVTRHREIAAADERPLDELIREAAELAPPRNFAAALLAGAELAVIAEVKRRSPSAGELAGDLDPSVLARQYARGGASCLSVLTDHEFFGGSAADLRAARDEVSIPVLRKDFTVGPRDIADARLVGADAVLLIAAVLDPVELTELHRLAADLGLAALVEVHDEHELDTAMGAGATLVGVNQRDLTTFAVDRERAVRVRCAVPAGVVTVAESGIRDAADAERLADAGFDAVLVGESLVTAADRSGAVRALRVRRRRRSANATE